MNIERKNEKSFSGECQVFSNGAEWEYCGKSNRDVLLVPMKRKTPARYAPEFQRARRIAGWDRIRAEQGKPAPTEAQRKARQLRNQRYFEKRFEKLRQQQQERAA